MNAYHECQADFGGGQMVKFRRTDKRIPYRESVRDWLQRTAINGDCEIVAMRYWQPWHCRHCRETIFELVGG